MAIHVHARVLMFACPSRKDLQSLVLRKVVFGLFLLCLLKPLLERPKRHQTKQQELAIQRNVTLRGAWLHYIRRPGGGAWQKGDAISRVHFHHKVVAPSIMTENGHVGMPLSVPKHLAKEIGSLPFVSYTSSDKNSGL